MKSFKLSNVYLKYGSSIGNVKEKDGPVGKYFDYCFDDLSCGEKTWEKAEIKMYKKAIDVSLMKSKLDLQDIGLIISADLNNQIVIGSYALKDFDIPYFGIFSACASSVQGMILASSFVQNKSFKNVMVNVSSHNATAEKQFRYPLEYGSIKQDYSTSTVSVASSIIISSDESNIKLSRCTIGQVKDSYINDTSDMGRSMAPSAYDTLYNHLKDFKIDTSYYDLIITGDLSKYGKELFIELLKEAQIEIKCEIIDAGEMIYDREKQHVNSGGSGCGCLPGYFFSYIYKMMQEGKYQKVLLIATGALLNPIMCGQKESIPVISHAIALEVV